MQERHSFSDERIIRDLLRPVTQTSMMNWVGFIVLGTILTAFLFAVGWMFYWGVGVTGLNRAAFWGFMIVNFVFWIGISHAGVMISAILRLTQAEWRRPVTRAAEVMTMFSLMTALLFPVIHTGRPWRTLYWAFPYDFWRGIWPDVRSALVMDPSAIMTYLTGTILFVYITTIPDFALLRDHSTGWRHGLYRVLALGFKGEERQWKMQIITGFLLAAIMLSIFVSVHSIVSWDFAFSLDPVWHSTVWAPYFVIGAVHSGVSAVVTLMALMRWMFKFDNYIRHEHFDAIGRLLVVVGTTWMWFFLLDIFFDLWRQDPADDAIMHMRFFEWPYPLLLAFVWIFGYFIPVPIWAFRRFRRNIKLMFWTSIMVNIGMWAERYWLVVPGLQAKYQWTFSWLPYRPGPVEITLVVGSFALVGFLLLLFAKLVPPVPVWDELEGQHLAAEIQVGKRTVPAIVREF
ncbi:NrfD/PsrC family molybdoenzyme membrane anchor subunit [Sphaerobacter sp.]|uniref:NrfD/PsrC family molybdoenzyme membrane anchor subunit n=1 Tax=Sphaerobacter sp. TaxID=2099654 RepID=UPI001DA8AB5A|nr:NrfD/PsrC family molybdoenzyme membrane anchor subunit [Sphaerobacter sp.]MBX5445951.1 polysulfide reductase NrfD [Sphaerobacter sp.]